MKGRRAWEGNDGRPVLFRIFFFLTFGFLVYQFLRMLSPFFDGIIIALTLALIFYPLHLRVLRWCRNRPNLAAATSVLALFLSVVVPMVIFLSIMGRQAAGIYPWARNQIQQVRANPQEALVDKLPAPIQRLWHRADAAMGDAEFDVQGMVLSNIERLGGSISVTAAAVLRNLLFVLFQTAIMLFTLFFLFRDGRRAAHNLIEMIPMEETHKEHVLERFNQTLTAVVRGMFITASVQGLLGGIGYAIAGVHFSVLLGFATAFMALIPLVGATAIWLPVGVFLLAKGLLWQGVFLLIWGAGVVSLVDNFLRPLLIGERAKLPILLLFFSTLGGLKAFGPMGIFIGPVVVATLLAFVKIYAEQMDRIRQRPAPPPAPPSIVV